MTFLLDFLCSAGCKEIFQKSFTSEVFENSANENQTGTTTENKSLITVRDCLRSKLQIVEQDELKREGPRGGGGGGGGHRGRGG